MPQQDRDTFFDGEHVKSIFWPHGGSFEVGKEGITKIVVVMEDGQMAGVPWFAVFDDHKMVSKWNGALIEGVGY